MKARYCYSCRRETGFKRALGFGTFLAIIFTFGLLYLIVLPFYPKRCVVCSSDYKTSSSVPPMRENANADE